MKINVQLYPPLKFLDGQDKKELNFISGSTVEDLLKKLDAAGALGEYGRQGVFALVENDVALNEYVLKPGQIVKILLRPTGG